MLTKNNNSLPNTEVEWNALIEKLKLRFNKELSIEAILFLIGIQTTGQMQENMSKETKQDLIHVGMCKILEPDGYYQFTENDKDGWPHYQSLKPLPNSTPEEQENFIKGKIIEYFAKETISTQ